MAGNPSAPTCEKKARQQQTSEGAPSQVHEVFKHARPYPYLFVKNKNTMATSNPVHDASVVGAARDTYDAHIDSPQVLREP